MRIPVIGFHKARRCHQISAKSTQNRSLGIKWQKKIRHPLTPLFLSLSKPERVDVLSTPFTYLKNILIFLLKNNFGDEIMIATCGATFGFLENLSPTKRAKYIHRQVMSCNSRAVLF
jgi:hypothetical protein